MSHEKKNNRTLVLYGITIASWKHERFKLRSLQWMMRTVPPVANRQQMWDIQEILSVITLKNLKPVAHFNINRALL